MSGSIHLDEGTKMITGSHGVFESSASVTGNVNKRKRNSKSPESSTLVDSPPFHICFS